jgi:hypothetical protein
MFSTLSTLGAQQTVTSPPQQIVPNLRFDVSIVDDGGGSAEDAEGGGGHRARQQPDGVGPFARQVEPRASDCDRDELPSSVTAQLDAVFEEGRKMLIAQAADPLSDRKTTIEVTVTVVK